MGGNKTKKPAKKGCGKQQTKIGKAGKNARDSDSRRDEMRRRLQVKHRQRNLDENSGESIVALALSYANSGQIAKACETFGKTEIPDELLEPHRIRYACLLLDNEQADLARLQVEKAKSNNVLDKTAHAYTLALIEFIASSMLEETDPSEAKQRLKEAFEVNPFVMELILFDSFDELLNNDEMIEKMPDIDKMKPEEAAIAYLICWGQLEIWNDATGAREWMFNNLCGTSIPKIKEPESRLLAREWLRARKVVIDRWNEIREEDEHMNEETREGEEEEEMDEEEEDEEDDEEMDDDGEMNDEEEQEDEEEDDDEIAKSDE